MSDPDGMTQHVSDGPDDRSKEERKRDRQMIELLNELRVALPGVQMLFAFLLAVPFTQRFARTTTFQRDVFYVTLIAAACSTACLIAPSAAHRLVFNQGARPWLIEHAIRVLILGLVFLGPALVGAILLVTAFLFDVAVVVIAPAALAAARPVMWFIRPAVRRSS